MADPYTDAIQKAGVSYTDNNQPDAYSGALNNSWLSNIQLPSGKGALDSLLGPFRTALEAAKGVSIPAGYGRDALLKLLNKTSGQTIYKDTSSGSKRAQERLQKEIERIKAALAPVGDKLQSAMPAASAAGPGFFGPTAEAAMADLPGTVPAPMNAPAPAMSAGPQPPVSPDMANLGPAAPTAIPPAMAAAMSPRRAPAAPMMPQGALGLPDVKQPNDTPPQDTPEEMAAMAAEANQPADATTPDAAPPARESLADKFRKRMAGREDIQPQGLSDQQRKMAILQAGLAMMASSRKPGASMLGSVGEGGLQGTAVAQEALRQNLALSERRRGEQNADIKSEITFEDKDADNVRLEKQQKALEDFHKTQNEIAKKALDQKITQQQAQLELAQAQLDLKRQLGEAANAVQVARLEAATARASAASDKTPSEIKVLEYLQKNPKAMETYGAMKSGGRDRQEERIDQGYTSYLTKQAADPMSIGRPPMTREQFAKGFEPGAQQNVKPDPASFKGKVIIGPDGKFKSDGKTWVKQ